MKDEKKAPKLRFKGFTDDWEQCKLRDVFVERNQKTVADENYPLCSFIAHKGVVPKTKYDRSFLVKSDDKKYKRTELNDFIYSSNNLETGSIGLNKFGNATISPVYSVFMVNGNSDFIAGLATTHRFIYEMIRFRQGVVYGQWRIHESDFLKIKYYIPQVLEQEKIGNLLSELDRIITLHEEKKRQLERLKSALLQKMFAEKQGYPVVRFKGFCDEWQGTKLGKVSKIVRGASPRPISDPKWFDNDSNVGWLRISDVTSQDGRIHHLEQHISKQGQAKTRVISEPHLLLSIAATVGKPLINYVKTGVHDGFLIFIEPHFDLEFMFQWLEMFRPQWSKYGQPGSQINLNSDLVKNQIIYLPSREEQNQIGIFFNQIDSLINLHQQKINNINSVKKSLLQKMFI